MLLTALLLSIHHGGEYHPPDGSCPASIFAGAMDNAGNMFFLDWVSQKLYVSTGKSIIHSWELPNGTLSDAGSEDESQLPDDTQWFSIAPAENGAYLLAGNSTFEITLDTKEIALVEIACQVHKLRLSGNQYYGLNFASMEIFEIPSCKLITTGPSEFDQDNDGIRVWSFAVSPQKYFLVGQIGDQALIYEQIIGESAWEPLDIDLYQNVVRPSPIAHPYGDLFWDAPRNRLLAVQGEVCFECYSAQKADTNAGKVLQVLPSRKVLAVGLRHPYHSQLVGDKLLIGDVGAGMFEELNVLDLTSSHVINFMWPLYEGPNVKFVDSPFFGGEMAEAAIVLEHCNIKYSWGYGVKFAIIGGAVCFLAILHAIYSRDWPNALIRIMIGIGTNAPVWYQSFHGDTNYYEAVLYVVQGDNVESLKPSAEKYIEWVVMLASVFLQKGGGFVAAIDAIPILLRERNGPYQYNLGFIITFYCITLIGSAYQFQKWRGSKKENKSSSLYQRILGY